MALVSMSSIVWLAGLSAVFLVKEDNSLKMNVVRMGSGNAEDIYAVISGPKEGDRILRTADSTTRSGQIVQESQSDEQ